MSSRGGKPPLIAFAVTLFVLGMIGVLTVFGLYASGYREVPVWLPSAVGGVTILGLALGLVVLFREARRP